MRNVRFELMRPAELEETSKTCPLAWIPVGTLEWHGRHLPVGLDALKAHAICERIAQKSGGVVLPPNYFSLSGMLFPWTFKYDPVTIARMTHVTLKKLRKNGFKVIFIITGHYPSDHVLLLMAVAEWFMTFNDAVVVVLPEFAMAKESGYNGDHAAKWETSLMMELFPELIEKDEMDKYRDLSGFEMFFKGVHGENPAISASRELGASTLNEIESGFSELAARLLDNPDKRIAKEIHREMIFNFIANGWRNAEEMIVRK